MQHGFYCIGRIVEIIKLPTNKLEVKCRADSFFNSVFLRLRRFKTGSKNNLHLLHEAHKHSWSTDPLHSIADMLRLFLLLTLLLYYDEVNEKFPGSQSYLQYASNRLDLKDWIISKWSKIVIDRFYTVNGIYMSIRYNNNMNQ